MDCAQLSSGEHHIWKGVQQANVRPGGAGMRPEAGPGHAARGRPNRNRGKGGQTSKSISSSLKGTNTQHSGHMGQIFLN